MHRVANRSIFVIGHFVCRQFVVVLLIMSASLNVVLSQELRESRAVSAPGLAVGATVPVIEARSLDGTPVTISFDDDVPTVLYYFRDQCGWCERNWANVNALVTQTRGRVRFIGIAATDGSPAYLREHPALFPIITALDERTVAAYRFSGTPQTVVVAPGGRVVKSWMGAYQKRQADDVAAFFGVTLPGLTPASVQR